MARVTVEDCLEKINNRFEMTLSAAHRARDIANGATPRFDNAKNHKPSVVALQEIAEGLTGKEAIHVKDI